MEPTQKPPLAISTGPSPEKQPTQETKESLSLGHLFRRLFNCFSGLTQKIATAIRPMFARSAQKESFSLGHLFQRLSSCFSGLTQKIATAVQPIFDRSAQSVFSTKREEIEEEVTPSLRDRPSATFSTSFESILPTSATLIESDKFYKDFHDDLAIMTLLIKVVGKKYSN